MFGFIKKWRVRRALRAAQKRCREMAAHWIHEARNEEDPWRKRSLWKRALYYWSRAKVMEDLEKL